MSVATCKRYLISFVVGVLATIFAQEVTSMLLVLAPPAGLSLGAALLAVAFFDGTFCGVFTCSGHYNDLYQATC